MTCRKAKKALPLLAGGDLEPRKAARVMGHVISCPSCRRELADLAKALAAAKAMFRKEAVPDWTDPEWHALMARIITEKAAARSKGARPLARPVLVSAVAAVILVAAGLAYLFRIQLFGPKGTVAAQGTAVVHGEELKAGQDVVSVTMVSRETGLQVVWFFNKNFEWKGDKQ